MGQNKPYNWDGIYNWKERLISLYKQGVSLNKLAMEFCTSPNTIKNKLLELGINIRGQKESHTLEMNKRYDRN